MLTNPQKKKNYNILFDLHADASANSNLYHMNSKQLNLVVMLSSNEYKQLIRSNIYDTTHHYTSIIGHEAWKQHTVKIIGYIRLRLC